MVWKWTKWKTQEDRLLKILRIKGKRWFGFRFKIDIFGEFLIDAHLNFNAIDEPGYREAYLFYSKYSGTEETILCRIILYIIVSD
jgi:hypothetical protein